MFDLLQQNHARVTRRSLFGSTAGGVGTAALASLLGRDCEAAPPGTAGFPSIAPRAKRVVMLWQGGGPSHVDLFDEKPMMRQMAGQDIPDSIRGTTRLSTMSSGYQRWPCLPAIERF
ncbi:MAG: DUF1501 domain-containing protein, partial [Planctomycetaceae bacterium]